MPRYNFDGAGGGTVGGGVPWYRGGKAAGEIGSRSGGKIKYVGGDPLIPRDNIGSKKLTAKLKPSSRAQSNAPLVKGVKGAKDALENMTLAARNAAIMKSKVRAQNRASGQPSSAGMSKIERAMGSTKKMKIAKGERIYYYPEGK